MSLTLEIRLPQSIDAETCIQEIDLLVTLFGDRYPKPRNRLDGITGQIGYILEAHLTEFPGDAEQIHYLEQRAYTLTGTPKIACKVCGPVTAPLLIVKKVEEEKRA